MICKIDLSVRHDERGMGKSSLKGASVASVEWEFHKVDDSGVAKSICYPDQIL